MDEAQYGFQKGINIIQVEIKVAVEYVLTDIIITVLYLLKEFDKVRRK